MNAEKIAVQVNTQEESRRVQEHLFSLGKMWGNGYKSILPYCVGKCISVDRAGCMVFDSQTWYSYNGYTILTVDEYFMLQNSYEFLILNVKEGKMKSYFMVWRNDGTSPTKKHDTESEARAEAERLAFKHPGDIFTIMQSLGEISTITVTCTKHE
jgi:hypothetical protein